MGAHIKGSPHGEGSIGKPAENPTGQTARPAAQNVVKNPPPQPSGLGKDSFQEGEPSGGERPKGAQV